MFYDLLATYLKVDFSSKNPTFCDGKVWQESGSRSAWICIGLAPWIRIRIEVKGRIRIRIRSEINAGSESKHWLRRMVGVFWSDQHEMSISFFRILLQVLAKLCLLIPYFYDGYKIFNLVYSHTAYFKYTYNDLRICMITMCADCKTTGKFILDFVFSNKKLKLLMICFLWSLWG